ncbi:surfactin synthase thioesterase subunit [Nocardiopsis sp. Huas11]|uniref:thioesterase II family protein n=1 Tax=Nocardiopsis sp. Huas11 TaxID=2183912 RepID=UPI000EAE0DA9|nr:alpha/beta fold hydrolase [Nocardiopsis sp. Huas11]RKS10363.1 surfactin synthase thioesterase subunit [Nocardiopsis sp. Huas11]
MTRRARRAEARPVESGSPRPKAGRWLRRYHRAPDAAARLVCFPHAGGSAGTFRPLSAALSPEVDVAAVQYPGRQDRLREGPARDVPSLAGSVTEAVAAEGGDRPTAFFGHSMGAAVAFEAAHLLRGRGVPTVLFVSGRRAPSRSGDDRRHRLSDDALAAYLRSLGGTEAAALDDPELRALVLPTIREDYRLLETHRPTLDTALDVPIVVLVGDADPVTTLDEARDWRRHTTAPGPVHVLPGGHFFLTAQTAAVASVITDALRPSRGRV